MKLIDIKEVSEILNVKESTLYSWVHKGSIPSFKLNGLLRFELEEILDWVNHSRPILEEKMIPHGTLNDSDIDSLIKKAIEGVTGKRYNRTKRESNLNQGLRKEDKNGTV